MAEYLIRNAGEADARGIKQLIDLVGINPTGLDWRRFIGAFSPEGSLVGCGQVKPHGREILELASIAVHPDHRGRGIARAIIEKLLMGASRPLYLMCMEHNGPIYRKFGFRILEPEEMPRYYRRIHVLFQTADIFVKTRKRLLVMKLE
jgi:N-acetylglutamate synthase-like GNAT family acetyltransferase